VQVQSYELAGGFNFVSFILSTVLFLCDSDNGCVSECLCVHTHTHAHTHTHTITHPPPSPPHTHTHPIPTPFHHHHSTTPTPPTHHPPPTHRDNCSKMLVRTFSDRRQPWAWQAPRPTCFFCFLRRSWSRINGDRFVNVSEAFRLESELLRFAAHPEQCSCKKFLFLLV
jgi:hypothetical protein